MSEENQKSENEHTKQDEIVNLGKPAIINAEAYKTIILYASRYANQAIPPAEWKEIYGILTGYVDDDFVRVENAYALTFGHDTDVQLDHRHYIFIDEIEQQLYEENNGHFVVGWFHSHPGLTLFFSYVFDHTLLGKKKEEKIGENVLTKYSTGFEIYRLTDVNMNPNSAEYDKNYNKVDYIVDGLNKYFFANVLSELSALVAVGKPLQSAYGEKHKNKFVQDEMTSEIDTRPDIEALVDIPMKNEVSFDLNNLFWDESSQSKTRIEEDIERAEQLIYEGNSAFQQRDPFTGVEKYRQGIKIYKKEGDVDRIQDLLRNLTKLCISNNHLVLAEEFATDLINLAEKQDNSFYKAVANYILGYILLKQGKNDVLKLALSKIRDAAILFENIGDYAGAGMCFNKIGTMYHTRLENYDSACLFYRESIENYNKAVIHNHPLRKSLWSKPELLKEKIIELRDILEELLPSVSHDSLRQKITEDLRSIIYNF
ncbi:MAG: Rgg family transcriptional regulator [Promethearchaeota archaeon]